MTVTQNNSGEFLQEQNGSPELSVTRSRRHTLSIAFNMVMAATQSAQDKQNYDKIVEPVKAEIQESLLAEQPVETDPHSVGSAQARVALYFQQDRNKDTRAQ